MAAASRECVVIAHAVHENGRREIIGLDVGEAAGHPGRHRPLRSVQRHAAQAGAEQVRGEAGRDEVLASIKRARKTLNKYGLSKVPIEISEVGWHTGFTTAQRAQWLRGLATKLPHAGLNTTRLMPYVWADSPEWSINNPDGSLGQIGAAYFAGIRDASATTKVRPQLKVKQRRGRVRFSGAIAPAVPGAHASLQRKRKGSAGFITVRRSTVRRLGNKRSRYCMTVRTRRRTSVYRVVVRPPASSGHARGTSRERRVRVTRRR